LTKRGADATIVATAAESLTLVKEQVVRPDVLLCDFNLRGSPDGVETVRHQVPRWPERPGHHDDRRHQIPNGGIDLFARHLCFDQALLGRRTLGALIGRRPQTTVSASAS